MRLGIDATNISSGGGITHLREILGAYDPTELGINEIYIWSSSSTAEKIIDKKWIKKITHPFLQRNFIFRKLWSVLFFKNEVERLSIDLIFTPGANYYNGPTPYVSMSQNMLPFEVIEQKRFPLSWIRIRFFLLRISQARSLKEASGVIFLSEYAKGFISREIDLDKSRTIVIPHGVSDEFFIATPPADSRVVRLLYVSIIDFYKHQVNLVRAIADLRSQGWMLTLTLVGPAYQPALRELLKILSQVDPEGEFIFYDGAVSYNDLPKVYKDHDGFVFASSCENLPNILLEAMATGIPIACSNKGPMPEILADAGVYFDPESNESIKSALVALNSIHKSDPVMGQRAVKYAECFSWQRCAKETFEFLKRTAQ